MISGNSERISPGLVRSEVGRPGGPWLTTGRPTSERVGPGEILSELTEIATLVKFWPLFLEDQRAVNLQKNSRGLMCISRRRDPRTLIRRTKPTQILSVCL